MFANSNDCHPVQDLPKSYIQQLDSAEQVVPFLSELPEVYEGLREEMQNFQGKLDRSREQCLRLLGGSSRARDRGNDDVAARQKELDEAWGR